MEFGVPNMSSKETRSLGVIRIASPESDMAGDEIRRSIRRPIWAEDAHATSISDRIRPGESVCIVVSDHTRKTAADRVLPVLVEELTANGCLIEDMSVLFASGIHRHPLEAEQATILGEEMQQCFRGRTYFHDPDDQSELVSVGETKRGHCVKLNRRAVESDRLVLIGGVVYHYHAGFGGGRKSLVPGLAARETIAHNHSLTLDPVEDRVHPAVGPGALDGNPVAEEMMDAAKMREPDFIINTVRLPDGRLAGVFAGDMEIAHREACALAARIYRCDVGERADLVIASAGAASNWIQSHKALFNASRAVKPEGRLVLVAPCPEGIGDERFRHWVSMISAGNVFAELRKDPQVLGQTALSTHERGKQATLVTGMSARDASDLGIRTAPDLESAVDLALSELRAEGIDRPSYFVMPDALYTVPFASEDS